MNAMDVYLGAAKILADDRESAYGCCDAINLVATGDPLRSTEAASSFYRLFKPSKCNFVYWGDQWGDTYEERRDCRILALCFMAAMNANR